MQRLEYVCSTGGSISFEGPIYGETMPSLRGRAWTYTLGARTLTGVAWQARELTLTVKAVDGETQLDRLRMLTDHDVLAHSRDSTISGLLRVDDVWECRALITKSEPQSITPRIIETQLTVTQLGPSPMRPATPTPTSISITRMTWTTITGRHPPHR